MNLKSVALGLALALAAVAPAQAQRGPANWELLGEETVGFGQDRDVINLRHNEDFYRGKAYRRLRFVAEGGEVRMRSIRLVYLNGHAEDMTFEQNLRPGQEIDIDLSGERSYLRQIEMYYKSKFGLSISPGGVRVNQATIKVFGENVRYAPPPPPPPPPAAHGPSWQSLGSERLKFGEEQLNFGVARHVGRLGRLRLEHRGEGGRVLVRDLHVRFRNGDVQRIRLDQELSPNELSQRLDLDGDTRFVDRVIVTVAPQRRQGQPVLMLHGSARPGREDGGGYAGGARPTWVPLGEADVGFRVDRDVIRIGQSEDWFRNRGFDRLHFVAENNDVHMMSIRIIYLNGYSEDYQVDRLIQAGSDLAVDLRGRRSYLREIEMIYRKRSNFPGRAIVKVFGEPPRY
jgi:hypothetical protein